MIANRTAWVLSRLSIEMKRFPAINENYTLETWIEDYNTRFSTRNMAILDSRGEVCGYARTIWLVLDLEARRTAQMEELNELRNYVLDRPCPIEPPTRMRADEGLSFLEQVLDEADLVGPEADLSFLLREVEVYIGEDAEVVVALGVAEYLVGLPDVVGLLLVL